MMKSYKALDTSKWYVFTGELMVKDTGDPLVEHGKPITVTSKPFKPLLKNGKVKVTFEVNTKGLTGKELVAFETAYRLDGYKKGDDVTKTPKTVVAEHKDLKDKGQTIKIVTPGTPIEHSPKTGDNAHNKKGITDQVTPGLVWVLAGEGIATVKYDGSCCAVIDGEFYKRYDAKHGKPVPEGAIKCQEEADPVTGHLPCWVKVSPDAPEDKWFLAARDNCEGPLTDGTYEAVGPHFQANPYRLDTDILIRHGMDIIDVPRTFEGIRDYLRGHNIEGIVFWKDGEPRCKIKRSDFGFEWPEK